MTFCSAPALSPFFPSHHQYQSWRHQHDEGGSGEISEQTHRSRRYTVRTHAGKPLRPPPVQAMYARENPTGLILSIPPASAAAACPCPQSRPFVPMANASARKRPIRPAPISPPPPASGQLVVVAWPPLKAVASGPEYAVLHHCRRLLQASRGRHDPRAAKLLRTHSLKHSPVLSLDEVKLSSESRPARPQGAIVRRHQRVLSAASSHHHRETRNAARPCLRPPPPDGRCRFRRPGSVIY